MDEENQRETLYQRFKESLRQPVTERFFDEDELVEIYDYAGDINDDYVQLEVLLCGARLYPESQSLTERKALLYLDTTDDQTAERTKAAQDFLADNPEASSILFDITRLEVNPPENATEALEFLFNQYDSFNDEEIIRFVNLAIDLGAYSWLIENLERIKKKVPFQPALLYELAREAEDADDNESLVKLADALIEHEPFNVNYWMMLLRGQARLDRMDEAKQTLEYAKALAADNPDIILALADIVYHNAPSLLSELVDPLFELVKANPNEFVYIDCLSAICSSLNYPESKITLLLRGYLNDHPGHVQALRQFLQFDTPDSVEYINRFLEAEKDIAANFDELAETVNTLLMRGAFRPAEVLLERLLDETDDVDSIIFISLVEVLFRLEKYDKVVAMCETKRASFEATVADMVKGPVATYMYTVALIKTGRFDDAYTFIKGQAPEFEKVTRTAPLGARMMYRCLMSLVDKMEMHGADDKMFWEYFDMLWVGKF